MASPSSHRLQWADRLPTLAEVEAARAANPDAPLWWVVYEAWSPGSTETRHFTITIESTLGFTDVRGNRCKLDEGPLGRMARPTACAMGARFRDAPPDQPYGVPPRRARRASLVFTPFSVEVAAGVRLPFVANRVELAPDPELRVRAWYDEAEATLVVKVLRPHATQVHAFHGDPPWTLEV